MKIQRTDLQSNFGNVIYEARSTFLPIGLRICCVELAKHSPSVGFTFGGIFVIHCKVASRRPKLDIRATR
jgi:hypothetical protein